MTSAEKEHTAVKAIQLLTKIKNLDLKINNMHYDYDCLEFTLDYVIYGEKRSQDFYFIDWWFTPDISDQDVVKGLKLSANLNDYQIVILKFAYYFYNWYKGECEQWTK